MAETAGWNLFWVAGHQLITPPAAAGALPGIARAAMLELAPSLGLSPAEQTGPPALLAAAEAVFTTNVVSGLREILALDGQPLRRDPRFPRWKNTFEDLVRTETA
jgi:branched-subunit amino acid aminotransferase/4-amino-4-deoxychorismate lyase